MANEFDTSRGGALCFDERICNRRISSVHGDTRMSTKAFASQADLEEKKVSFTKLSDNAYA